MMTRTQVKMAVAALGLTLDEAEQKLMVPRSTLHRLMKSDDAFERAHMVTRSRIRVGLESQGIVFGEDGSVRLDENKVNGDDDELE